MPIPPPQPATPGDIPVQDWPAAPVSSEAAGLPERFLAGASAHTRAAAGAFSAELLRFGPGVDALPAALEREPDEPRLQLLAAVLQLYALDPPCQRQAGQHLAAVQAGRQRLDAFGRDLLEALLPWRAGDHGIALQRLETLSAASPDALLPLKLIEWLCFCRGQELHGPRLLDRALQLEQRFPTHPDRLAIASFALELCGRLEEARGTAEAAIAARPDNAWADHTLAHWALRSGRLEEGLHFQQGRCASWAHTSAGLRVHNFWHLALLHLGLGDSSAAAELLGQLLPPPENPDQDPAGVPLPVGELIDLIALGWHLELAGHPQPDLWGRLRPHLAGRLDEPLLPFLAAHYAWVLGRCGHGEPLEQLLDGCRRAAAAPLPEARWSWAVGGVELVRGVAALAAGRIAEARALLLPRRDQLRFGGGSDAQVQVLSRTLDWLERHPDG